MRRTRGGKAGGGDRVMLGSTRPAEDESAKLDDARVRDGVGGVQGQAKALLQALVVP